MNTQLFSQTYLFKWLSCVVSIYLYSAFDGMLLSCHVHVSEWIYTLVWLNVLPNDWVFVYKGSRCVFESRCCHLNFSYCTCFEQVIPWYLRNYRVCRFTLKSESEITNCHKMVLHANWHLCLHFKFNKN